MRPYYQDKFCTIYHGDCRDVLPHLEPVDLVLTDPPYGIDAVLGMGGRNRGSGGMWKGVSIAGDENCEVRDSVLGQFDEFAIFGSPKRSPMPGAKAVLVWDKGEHTGAGDLKLPWKPCFELIFIRGRGWFGEKRESAIVRQLAISGCVGRSNDGRRHHPFEKPTSIICYLLLKHSGKVILDPFMGSGTTLRAAKDLGRRSIGIEIEEKYCEIAAKRLSQEVLDFGSAPGAASVRALDGYRL